ncbi:hypothetical protein [Humibacter sp. RRB41]|uniref:hypothetical protein n=1 Tax=Humibacter sp. RRB41 TaxID=2919946 RepID=UPI001FAAAA08|nr:hypothetical protein [Humibacter sp. RRB41]
MGVVAVDWHFFSITDAEDSWMSPAVPPDDEDWFLGSREREIQVFTGIAAGKLEVPVHVLQEPPTRESEGDWDDVAEATMRVPSGKGQSRGTRRLRNHPRGGCQRLASHPRVYRTRDNDIWDLVEDFPRGERYLIEVWPTSTPPRVRDADRAPVTMGATATSGGVASTPTDDRAREMNLQRQSKRQKD